VLCSDAVFELGEEAGGDPYSRGIGGPIKPGAPAFGEERGGDRRPWVALGGESLGEPLRHAVVVG
jgi:hypothetical protein